MPYVAGAAIWFFIVFFGTFFFLPDEHFNTSGYIGFLTFPTLIISGVVFLHVSNTPRIVIEKDHVSFSTPFWKITKRFLLADLVSFSWSGSPVIVRTRYAQATQKMSNAYFEIQFKHSEVITVLISDYANFKELQNFFYNQAVSRGIIQVRPLSERKRSRLRLRK